MCVRIIGGASIVIPAHRNCSTTILRSKCNALLMLFGLMHRTYCTVVPVDQGVLDGGLEGWVGRV